MKMCEWCKKKPAELWTFRQEDTGRRYYCNGVLTRVQRPDNFVALCGDCASVRINQERDIDFKEIKNADKKRI